MSDTDPKRPPSGPRQPAPRNATEVRQGIRSGRVIWVLIGGLVLVAIAYLVIGEFTSVGHPPPGIGVVNGPAGSSSSGAKPQAPPPGAK